MKNRIVAIVMFVLLALLIPVSLAGAFLFYIATQMADPTMVGVLELRVWFFLLFLFVTYAFSYLIALVHTIRKRGLTLISFLPLLHVGLITVSFVLAVIIAQ